MADAGVMRWWAIWLMALAVTTGCERARQRTPAFSDAQLQELKQDEPGITAECLEKIRWGGIEVVPEATDQCFKMDKPKRWSGILHYDLEEVRFCADAVRHCPPHDGESDTWLEWSPQAETPKTPVQRPSDPMVRDFEIQFIGRRTKYPGSRGHLGQYPYAVIVDRIISIRELREEDQGRE